MTAPSLSKVSSWREVRALRDEADVRLDRVIRTAERCEHGERPDKPSANATMHRHEFFHAAHLIAGEGAKETR